MDFNIAHERYRLELLADRLKLWRRERDILGASIQIKKFLLFLMFKAHSWSLIGRTLFANIAPRKLNGEEMQRFPLKMT